MFGFGAALAKAGADVTFIARGAHIAAMKRAGLKVLSPRGDTHLIPTQATDNPVEIGQGRFEVVGELPDGRPHDEHVGRRIRLLLPGLERGIGHREETAVVLAAPQHGGQARKRGGAFASVTGVADYASGYHVDDVEGGLLGPEGAG